MKQTQYTTEQVNKAIFDVLTTQFKKDAKEAHDIVKQAGYTTEKQAGGCYDVINEETRKRLTLFSYSHERVWIPSKGYSDYRMHIYRFETYTATTSRRIVFKRKDDEPTPCPIDFIGILNTPINDEYREALRLQNQGSHAREAYADIKSCCWSIDYEEREIELKRREIERLQDAIIRSKERINESRKRLRKIYKDNHITQIGERASRCI